MLLGLCHYSCIQRFFVGKELLVFKRKLPCSVGSCLFNALTFGLFTFLLFSKLALSLLLQRHFFLFLLICAFILNALSHCHGFCYRIERGCFRLWRRCWFRLFDGFICYGCPAWWRCGVFNVLDCM